MDARTFPGSMGVSIHSPRRSEGRLSARHRILPHFPQVLRYAPEMFQSTPPAEARGDSAVAPGRRVARVDVSIHSPRRSEGRHRTTARTMKLDKMRFQSTPPAEARGDYFTTPANPYAWPKLVSIHSPRRSEGRPFRSGNATSYAHRNRPFQSTPPAEARGDPRSPYRRGSRPRRHAVSIHSPRRSEGRHHSDRQCPIRVSIHSPRRSEGRPASSTLAELVTVSIHSPRRSEGRHIIDDDKTMSADSMIVSIHSPRRSEGRLWRP